MLRNISLPLLIGGLIAFWAVLFFIVHGVAIIGYVALQVVTTGVFVYGIYWADKRQARIDAASADGRTGSSDSTAS